MLIHREAFGYHGVDDPRQGEIRMKRHPWGVALFICVLTAASIASTERSAWQMQFAVKFIF